MDKRQEFENLKDFFKGEESKAFVQICQTIRSLQIMKDENGRTVRNMTLLNSTLLKDIAAFCVVLQNNRVAGMEAADNLLNGKEKAIQKLKAENGSLKKQNDILISENDSLKKELEELKEANKELSFYLDMWKKRTEERETEAQSYLEYAVELEDEKEKKRQSLVCNGKALELPPRVIKEVIRQWCLGRSIKQIQADTGASRGQIERIVKGNLKHKESRKKVLKSINYLLKVNQSVVFIDKLKTLKDLYSK